MLRLSLYPTYQVFMTLVITMVVSALLFPLWIRLLRYRNIGQQIRADGPQGHLVKQGTPTMGGVLILAVVTGVYLASGLADRLGIIGLIAMLMCGLLGLVDDYTKVVRERSLGLTPRMKLSGQGVAAIVVALLAVNWANLSPVISVPLSGIGFDLGALTSTFDVGGFAIAVPWLYLVFVFIMVAGMSNAVNLTDGLDGLAAGTALIVTLAYAGIAFRQNHLELALFAAAIGGACVGFLWYNSFPAEIFMGDTGSLGLGAAIAALAIVTKTELLLLIIGGIYIVETLSVILQVASFKLFKRRIFKMAPIHHHFEMKGWSETKIMVRFWIITGITAGLGFALYFVSSVRK